MSRLYPYLSVQTIAGRKPVNELRNKTVVVHLLCESTEEGSSVSPFFALFRDVSYLEITGSIRVSQKRKDAHPLAPESIVPTLIIPPVWTTQLPIQTIITLSKQSLIREQHLHFVAHDVLPTVGRIIRGFSPHASCESHPLVFRVE